MSLTVTERRNTGHLPTMKACGIIYDAEKHLYP